MFFFLFSVFNYFRNGSEKNVNKNTDIINGSSEHSVIFASKQVICWQFYFKPVSPLLKNYFEGKLNSLSNQSLFFQIEVIFFIQLVITSADQSNALHLWLYFEYNDLEVVKLSQRLFLSLHIIYLSRLQMTYNVRM